MAIRSSDYLKDKFENFDRPNGSDFTDLVDSCYNAISSLSGIAYGDLTIFGDISASGYFYGDGSRLSGIVSGDNSSSTVVRSTSANWNNSYTLLQTNSSFWDIAYNISTDFVELSPSYATKTLLNSVSSLLLEKSIYQNTSANFESSYTTLCSNSALWLQDFNSVLNQGNTTNLSFTAENIKANGVVIIGNSENYTFYVSEDNTVGINTENPNEALTVVGKISANDGISISGNSAFKNTLSAENIFRCDNIIIKNPLNDYYKIIVTESGTISAVLV